MADKFLIGFTAVCNTVAVALFAASLGATSYHYSTLYHTNWVSVQTSSDAYFYFGFKAVAASFKVEGFSFTEVIHTDISCSSNNFDLNVCKKCGGKGGEASEALLCIAFIFSVLSLI